MMGILFMSQETQPQVSTKNRSLIIWIYRKGFLNVLKDKKDGPIDRSLRKDQPVLRYQYSVVLENERVSVLRFTINLGTEPPNTLTLTDVLYAESSFKRRLSFPDGEAGG